MVRLNKRLAGPVTASRPTPRGKWSLVIAVAGERCELRLDPESAVTILDAPPVTARTQDHQPVNGHPNGVACTCGWVPQRRATRMSMRHVAFNRHRESLGLLGI